MMLKRSTKTIQFSYLIIVLVQVRLKTEVPRTPSSTQPGFELMNSRSWQGGYDLEIGHISG